jgi:hypothetical protein
MFVGLGVGVVNFTAPHWQEPFMMKAKSGNLKIKGYNPEPHNEYYEKGINSYRVKMTTSGVGVAPGLVCPAPTSRTLLRWLLG